jgi:hypothetical protein
MRVNLGVSDVLKIVGILIAGVLGVLGTVTETRDKKTNQITTWGRSVLALTVAGSLLALGSQVVDSISSNERDHEILENLQTQSEKATSILTQDGDILSGIRQQSTTTNDILSQNTDILKSTHEQSAVATTSLHSIQDILSQIDSVQIEAEFELPQSDPRVAALAREFHQWANSDKGNTANCSVFHPHEPTATISCLPFDPSDAALATRVPSLRLLGAVWNAVPMVIPRVWINRQPKALATLLAPDGMSGDLFMFNCRTLPTVSGALIYYEENRKIYLRPGSFASNSKNPDCWLSKETVIGVHSIAEAQMVVEFDWKRSPGVVDPDPLLYSIRPDYVRLTAGPNTFFLQSPKTTVQKPEGPYAVNYVLSEFTVSTLPDRAGFLNHVAGNPPARMKNAIVPQ